MQLELDKREAEALTAAMEAYLVDLNRELAGTDVHEFAHQLGERATILEILLARLRGLAPEIDAVTLRAD